MRRAGIQQVVHSLLPIHPTSVTLIIKAFVETGRKLGYRVGDYNGASPNGFSFVQATVKDGKRISASTAFLHPAMKRKNLFIGTGVTVRKVVIEKRKAIGVKYVHFDENHETVVKARKEVILSAGAIGSLHILLLSGIAPFMKLNKTGIQTISDLPVGKNLHDHLFLPLEYIIPILTMIDMILSSIIQSL